MAASEGLHNAPAAGSNPDPQGTQQSLELPASSTGDEERNSSPYPAHPIAQLQGPFEESILESNDASAGEWVVNINAQTRRRDLLENDEYERLCGRKWRQRGSER